MNGEEERIQRNEAQTSQNGDDRVAGRESCKGLQTSMAELAQASRSQTEALNNLRDDIHFQPDPTLLEEESSSETAGGLNLSTAVTALFDPSSEGTAPEGEGGVSNTSPDLEARNSDVIDSLTQGLFPNPKQSSPIGEKIASLVNKILTGELSGKTLKTKAEQYPAPDNCKHLTTVPVDEEISDLMARKTKTVDLAFQKVQEPLVQGLSTLTILADQLLKDIQNNTTTDTAVVFQKLMDGIALVESANWNITMERRELIKPDLSPPYTRLCKGNIQPSTKLLGDDLSKHVREMADARKAGQQMQKGLAPAKIMKQKRYRPRPYDRPQTSYSQTWQPGNKRTYKRPFLGHSRASSQTATNPRRQNNSKSQ